MPQPWTFDALYEQVYPHVYRFSLSMLRDPALAEDITNEVFLRAFRASGGAPPPPENARAWVIVIARNAIRDELRSRVRWRRWFQRVGRELSTTEADVQHRVAVRDELRHVTTVMRKLSERDRCLVAMRVGADLSYREIGSMLSMQEHSAKVATLRALGRLRSLLESERS